MNVFQKIIWSIVMAGLAGMLYLAFRGYLTPALLIDFANTMICEPARTLSGPAGNFG